MASKQSQFDLKKLDNDVPTYFIDGAVGSAWVNNTLRVLLAQYTVDPTPGAEVPGFRHTVELIMTVDGARALIEYLEQVPGVKANA